MARLSPQRPTAIRRDGWSHTDVAAYLLTSRARCTWLRYFGDKKRPVSIETGLFSVRLGGLEPSAFWTRLSIPKFADRRRGRAVSKASIRPEGLIGSWSDDQSRCSSDQALTLASSDVRRAACYARPVVADGSLHHTACALATISMRLPTSG